MSFAVSIARITPECPENQNALTRPPMLELKAECVGAVAWDDMRLIALTGAGRGFSARRDLSGRDPSKHDSPLDGAHDGPLDGALDGAHDSPLDGAAIRRAMTDPILRTICDDTETGPRPRDRGDARVAAGQRRRTRSGLRCRRGGRKPGFRVLLCESGPGRRCRSRPGLGA